MTFTNVHIEFDSVQKWLFSVPRLRAMVGANTLLGEVLRNDLPELATAGAKPWSTVPVDRHKDYPSSYLWDPLTQQSSPIHQDNPARDAELGILSRDGGHFEAIFKTRDDAEQFEQAARGLLHRKLPNLKFSIKLSQTRPDVSKDCIPQKRPKSKARISQELPVFAPCDWQGGGLASSRIKQGEDQMDVSFDMALRHDAALRSSNRKAFDIVSLLSEAIALPRELTQASTFQKIAGNKYLAVIHADGNAVGSGLKLKPGESAAERDLERAKFFHLNRALIRDAVRNGMETCLSGSGDAKRPPIVPLMIGGDDILIVCQAQDAFPLVIEICQSLQKRQKELNRDKHSTSEAFMLTLGVGIAISKHNIPFHHLHAMAEELAASAKRKYRGVQETSHKCSMVDWAIYSTSWLDDLESYRKRHWVQSDADSTYSFSKRPLPVLTDRDSLDLASLIGLYEGAERLQDAARSQLRYLGEQLRAGRNSAELAFNELSDDTKKLLKGVGLTGVWEEREGCFFLTSLLDLIETFEISHLGTSSRQEKKSA